jgi:hypothetical protein
MMDFDSHSPWRRYDATRRPPLHDKQLSAAVNGSGYKVAD